MHKLRFFTLALWLAGSLLAMPAAAAPAPRLTFDLLCDGTPVCRIQNADLDMLNGQVIWFYAQQPATSGEGFTSQISLELPGGSTRGVAVFGPDGGYLSLGRNGEGSLDRFQAEGDFALARGSLTLGRLMFHYDGEYHTN